MENQPAIKSYVFEKGYKDLWNTIQDSWKANLKEAKQHFGQSRSAFGLHSGF